MQSIAKQVITIAPSGAMAGLDHKRKGLDLAKLGHARKRRVSEIYWSTEYQQWMVQFQEIGRFAGRIVDVGLAWLSGVPANELQARGVTVSKGEILLIPDYEDAVAVEVAVIQGLQTKGYVCLT